MRLLRGLGGALLWIVASLVGLVAVVLCVTVILLPLGIPLLMVAKKMFGRSVGLMLPRALSHPIDEGSKRSKKGGKQVLTKAGKASKKGRKKVDKFDKSANKKADKFDKRANKKLDKGGKKIKAADKAGKRGDKKVAELAKKG